jgi:hypothetical protein
MLEVTHYARNMILTHIYAQNALERIFYLEIFLIFVFALMVFFKIRMEIVKVIYF